MNIRNIIVLSTLSLSLTACSPTNAPTPTERISVGKVQREIRVGMSTAQVIEILGSPNIVTTDNQRREQWVYDKIATESVYTNTSGGIAGLVFGGIGGGLGVGNASKDTYTNSQKTLTIIIKFDSQSRVRDFAYHNSSF